jgi:hypothetical protein
LSIALEPDPQSSQHPQPVSSFTPLSLFHPQRKPLDMAKTKKSQGKLARYVNTPEAMERFRRHYGVLDDVHLAYRFWENAITGEPGDVIIPLVAIIEGGVRFPIDPLLADFLDYFRISPTQISPNIFRIVNGVAELNRRLGFNLTVHDIIATYFLRTT